MFDRELVARQIAEDVHGDIDCSYLELLTIGLRIVDACHFGASMSELDEIGANYNVTNFFGILVKRDIVRQKFTKKRSPKLHDLSYVLSYRLMDVTYSAEAAAKPHGHSAKLSRTFDEIGRLHHLLWDNGYLLEHPEKFIQYKQCLKNISVYLKRGGSLDCSDLTLRELSYLASGDTKFMNNPLYFCIGLEDITKTKEPTPKGPLWTLLDPSYEGAVVLSENRDPYLAISEELLHYKKPLRIMGETIVGVVWTCGANLLSQSEKLEKLAYPDSDISYIDSGESTTAASPRPRKLLVWTDIDYSGLRILVGFMKCASETLTIEPYSMAYALSVQCAMHRFGDAKRNAAVEQNTYMFYRDLHPRLISHYMHPKEVAYMMCALDNSRSIPQEALTGHELKLLMHPKN